MRQQVPAGASRCQGASSSGQSLESAVGGQALGQAATRSGRRAKRTAEREDIVARPRAERRNLRRTEARNGETRSQRSPEQRAAACSPC